MSPLRSARISTLEQAVGTHSEPHAQEANAALDAFWIDIEADGAPLIEPALDAPDESLITFLHRGDVGAKNVTLISALTGFDFPASQFTLMPGSDVWYFTVKARNDLRTSYHIAIDDTLISLADETDMERRSAGWKLDSLNPHIFTIPADEETPGDQEYTASVVILPAARARPFSTPREGVPAGNVECSRFTSALLGNERRLWVYTPPQYSTVGKPYPLVVLFDGPATLDTIPSPTIVENLIADGQLPSVVLLVIESLGEARTRELMCNPTFADFLAHEALPWVSDRYHVTNNAEQIVLAGQSAGGVAAMYGALRYPNLFGAVLSQSGAFWWIPEGGAQLHWLARQFAESTKLPVRFYLDAGLLEDFAGPGSRGESILGANRIMRDTLLAKGYPLTYAELNSGHEYIFWRETFADGLVALLGPRAR